MGIITVLVLSIVIFGTAALFDGITALYYRAKESMEWRKIKRIYF